MFFKSFAVVFFVLVLSGCVQSPEAQKQNATPDERFSGVEHCSEGARALNDIEDLKKRADSTTGDVVKLAGDGLKQIAECKDPYGKLYLRAMLTTQLGQATAVTNPREGARLLQSASLDLQRCVKAPSEQMGKVLRARCFFQKGENQTLISRLPIQRAK